MANPTTNYGWPMPTSADLVTDLPADFALFGQPVDTSLKALNPETTLGDIAYRSATSNTNTRLGIGTNGQVLAVSSGVPAWTTTADVTPLTTKGDLFTFSTVDARLGVGSNDQILVANSSTATGLEWQTPASGSSFAGCRLNKLSGNQSIADSTYVAVTWPTEVFDVGGYHTGSESKITIPTGKGGYYRVSWRQGVTAAASTCTIYTNGTGGTRNAFINVANAEANGSTMVLYLAAGDYIEVYLRQTSGTAKLAFDENSGAVGFIWFDCNYLGA